MHAKDGVRLKLDEERAPVVIPLAPQAVQFERQTRERSGIQGSELGLVAITLILMGFLFAFAHHIVQHPWLNWQVSLPISNPTGTQPMIVKTAEGGWASKTVR